MKITIDGKSATVPERTSIGGLLLKKGISGQVAIVKVNGRARPETYVINEGEKVEIIKVVFGG